MITEPYRSILKLCEQPMLACDMAKHLGVRGQSLANYLVKMKKDGRLLVVGEGTSGNNKRYLWLTNPDYVPTPAKRLISEDRKLILEQLEKHGEMTSKQLAKVLPIGVTRIARLLVDLRQHKMVQCKPSNSKNGHYIYSISTDTESNTENEVEDSEQLEAGIKEHDAWWEQLQHEVAQRKQRRSINL